jgi:hypothetical protein
MGVLDSNFNRKMCYLDGGFSRFSLVPAGKCQEEILSWLCHTFFPIFESFCRATLRTSCPDHCFQSVVRGGPPHGKDYFVVHIILYKKNSVAWVRLSAKLVPTHADRGCHVVSITDSYGRILGFLDRSRYFFFQVAPQLYSWGRVDPHIILYNI